MGNLIIANFEGNVFVMVDLWEKARSCMFKSNVFSLMN